MTSLSINPEGVTPEMLAREVLADQAWLAMRRQLVMHDLPRPASRTDFVEKIDEVLRNRTDRVEIVIAAMIAFASRPAMDREAVARIGDLRRGDHPCDADDRLCAYGHDIPAGQALYWPANPSSQYDDSDPHCLEHAVERALDRGMITRGEANTALALSTPTETPESEGADRSTDREAVDVPEAFEAWWHTSPRRNRLLIGYSDKKCLAFDAFQAGMALALTSHAGEVRES